MKKKYGRVLCEAVDFHGIVGIFPCFSLNSLLWLSFRSHLSWTLAQQRLRGFIFLATHSADDHACEFNECDMCTDEECTDGVDGLCN